MNEIPPPGSLPTIPGPMAGNCLPQGLLTSWQRQEMWKLRLGSELADSGWWAGLCQMRSRGGQLCISFCHSTNIYGGLFRPRRLGPSLVRIAQKSGSDEEYFKSSTHS